MSKKHIVWIDDYPYGIQEMSKWLFPILWNKDVDSTVLFLGDYYKSSKTDQAFDSELCGLIIDDLTDDAIHDGFEYCDGCGDTPILKKTVGANEVTIDLSDSISIVPNITDVLNTNDATEYTTTHLDALIDNIELTIKKCINGANLSDVIIAIDMMLFFNDHVRLTSGKSIISMHLYGKLKEKGYQLLLYSGWAYQQEWDTAWLTKYNELFTAEQLESTFKPITRNNKPDIQKKIDDMLT